MDELGIKRRTMKQAQTGELNNQWKGGRRHRGGYVEIYIPEHPRTKKYIMEHILVIEKKLGRYLKDNEVVHHINGLKNDNRIENLDVVKLSTHGNTTHVSYNQLLPLLLKKGIVKYNMEKHIYELAE